MQGDTREDIEELRKIMKDLTSTDYPYDLYNYGNLMYKSALTVEDYREAFKYLKLASEKGWLDADFLLAQMYRDGNGVDRSIEDYEKRLIYAAEGGHAKAMSALAEAYLDGKYIQKDNEKAFQWYMRSASSGNMKSQYQVAVMLSSGIGCEKDEEAAKQWFARYSSTALNDSRKIAMDTMKSRRIDIDISNDMLKAMSKSFHPQSMVSLASKYESGNGFKKNTDAAVSLLEKASVAGGSPRTKLAERYLEGDDESKKKAFKLLRSAASYGDSGAMYRGSVNLQKITINSKDLVLEDNSLGIGTSEENSATVDVLVPSGYKLPANVGNDYTTLNVSYIGERPYPWVNIVGAIVCALGIIGILYGMRQV